jgi:NhaP-type Na+/H+ or K+/H+ antiporter
MEAQHFGFLFAGLIALAVAWLPLFLRFAAISLPMVAVAAGWLLFRLHADAGPVLEYRRSAEILTEAVLVVAVMGAGLRIDRRFALRSWASTWRLLGIVMPLSVAAIAACGVWLLGLPLGHAILLGGILAPTDPVLASNVQVGPPGVGEEGEVRFGLTSEAGLNDGLAFPFVTLGILLTVHGTAPSGWLGPWLAEVAWKLPGGIIVGAVLGGGLVYLNRILPKPVRLARSRSAMAAIGITFLIYAVAEWLDTYGFVAVFAGAVAIRNTSQAVDYHRRLNDFAEEVERLSSALVLVLFGGALADGLLADLSWAAVAFGFVVLLAVRPLATAVGFLGAPQGWYDRAAFGYFGIRGLGSLYYATYAINQLGEEVRDWLLPVVGFVVLASILLYGVTGDAAMRLLGGSGREAESSGKSRARREGAAST